MVEYPVAEGVEPGLHAVGERSGAGDEFDGLDGEPGCFEQAPVECWWREEAGCCGFGVDVKGRECGLQGGADGGDIPVAAHLSDKAAAGAKGPMDTTQHCLLAGEAGDPVEGGVGEDSVELVMVRQGGGVVLLDMEVALAGGGEHRGRGIDTEEDGTCGGQLFGKSAVSAAKIEDFFTGLRGQEGHYV